MGVLDAPQRSTSRSLGNFIFFLMPNANHQSRASSHVACMALLDAQVKVFLDTHRFAELDW
jgi:hypothetical protein